MKKKKITLFWPLHKVSNPERVEANLSIAYLSKVLEQNNFEVSCIDANLLFYEKWGYKSPEDEDKETILRKFIQEVEKTDPDILGIGSWTQQMPFVAEFTKEFKARSPEIPIIIGGTNATSLPEKTLELLPHVNFLVRGEGELTLLELVKEVSSGRNFKKIEGISFKEDGKIINNPNRSVIKDLDELPFLDFENFVFKGKLSEINILSARGCPFNCTYCAVNVNMGNYRFHSIEYVNEQIDHLLDMYGSDYIVFSDDDFLASKQRIKRITPLLVEKECRYMTKTGRIDKIDHEVIQMLKKSHFDWLSCGVESIVPTVLEFYNKSPNVTNYIRKVEKAVDIVNESDINLALSFILGAPVETKGDMLANFKLMEKISKKCSRFEVGHLMLYPGTTLWDKYEKGELLVFRAYGSTSPFDDLYSDLVWMTPELYLFKNQHIGNEELKNFIDEMIEKIYSLEIKYSQ